MISSKNFLRTYCCSIDTNEGLIAFSFFKFNQSIGQCEQSKIFSDAYIFAGMIFRSALANDDITGNSGLSAVDLYSETLALRIASVLYTTFSFFVCHILKVVVAAFDDYDPAIKQSR